MQTGGATSRCLVFYFHYEFAAGGRQAEPNSDRVCGRRCSRGQLPEVAGRNSLSWSFRFRRFGGSCWNTTSATAYVKSKIASKHSVCAGRGQRSWPKGGGGEDGDGVVAVKLINPLDLRLKSYHGIIRISGRNLPTHWLGNL